MKTSFEKLRRNYLFELSVAIFFIFYVALCLTPSSYGIVLNMFGLNGEGLLWGHPRAIRSDEWAVWTPYFQSLVNNGFARFNTLSLYHEDFRGFSALPIHDWAIAFKPLLWPFLILNNAYAFSLHHALIMVTFIIGWKQLVDRLFSDAKQCFISGLFSLLLFFSGFVQGWWTTLGPVLALTPWLFIALLQCEKITPLKMLVFSYISIVWLLSHTYPPIIISCSYVALVMVICFKRELFNVKTILGLSLAGGMALAIVYVYFSDAIQIMSQTVYPGQRISRGGAVSWELWISTFIPYINHSNYQPLLATNICELGVVTSLLPMMAVIFVRYRSFSKDNLKIIAIFFVALVVMSLWMLIPVSPFIAKVTLLDRIPGSRLVWAFGLTLNVITLYVLIRGEVLLNWLRVILFFASLFGCYAASCYNYDLPLGKKSAWELIAGLVLVGVVMLAKNRLTENAQKVAVLLFSATAINFIYFGYFNPAQSAKPIFELKNSPVLQSLKEQQNSHPEGWLVVTGYPGAVLQGVGLNAVTHVLMMPKLEFFRRLFPDMDIEEFNQIFNRYAHIQLSDEPFPYSPQADVIRVPKHVFGLTPKIEKITELLPLDKTEISGNGGYVDVIKQDGSRIEIRGWGLISSPNVTLYSNMPEPVSATFDVVSRPDVAAALKDKRLINAGFKITFDLLKNMNVQYLCLYTQDPVFGVKKIMPGNNDMLYKCANK